LPSFPAYLASINHILKLPNAQLWRRDLLIDILPEIESATQK
jgi:hypothetical protein